MTLVPALHHKHWGDTEIELISTPVHHEHSISSVQPSDCQIFGHQEYHFYLENYTLPAVPTMLMTPASCCELGYNSPVTKNRNTTAPMNIITNAGTRNAHPLYNNI